MGMIRTPRSRRIGGVLTIAAIVACAGAWANWPEPTLERATQTRLSSNTKYSPPPLSRQDAANQLIEWGVAQVVFDSASPHHQEMLLRLAAENTRHDPPAVCFAPGTAPELVAAFEAAVFGNASAMPRYQANNRWTTTATNGGGLTQGMPTTLTYSFVPDGVNIPGGVQEPASPSNLFAFLNGIYGNTATWQAHYAGVFARWSTLSGLTYVFEPNDDGAAFSGSPGVLGVRGDLRMAGHPIDGNSGILAYNSFPNNGDMVIDTADNFYTNLSNNSLALRNVLSHEHGHGMGISHVCPIQQTKLMEPFFSSAFDGPRHDDIRIAQRHYGDPNEPDNTRATATVVGPLVPGPALILGNVPNPAVSNGSTLSIDADGEEDYFRISVDAPRGLTVIATPLGLSYDSSAQSSQMCGGNPASCCSGNVINSAAMANLAVQVQDSTGAVLTTVDAQAIGLAETAVVGLPAAGDYYVRIFESNTVFESQLYRLSLQVGNLPLTISLPNGPPTSMTAGIATSFIVEINPVQDTLVPDTARLLYRYAGGGFQIVQLVPLGGNLYRASLPPPTCSDNPQFYVIAQGATTGLVTNPLGAPTNFYSAIVGTQVVLISHNFETSGNFTVENSITLIDGGWDRGVPIVNANCQVRGAPAADADGSGQCWLTDNNSASQCNSDVDGGSTILLSDTYDVSTLSNATVNYARWFANIGGQNPQSETMVMEVSQNGGANWVNLETVGPTTGSPNGQVTGGWFNRSFAIANFVTPTTQFRIRFIAQDPDPGAVVEAAIDAFSITGRNCTPVTCTSCDLNGDAAVNGLDLSVLAALVVGETPSNSQICAGDLNLPKDGIVDFQDVDEVINCVLSAP